MNFSQLTGNEGMFCDGDWIEKKDQDVNGNVRLIQLADIGEGTFKDKSSRYLTEDTARRLNCTFLQQGDILIARLPDPLGRACIFPLNGKFITAVDIAILRIKDCAYNPRYVMYMVNSPQFRKEISRYESGTTRKRISRKNLDKIQFNMPDLSTQERIVSKIEELFSKLDASVAELQTAKEKLKVYRQAVYSSVYEELCALQPITNFFEITGGLTKNSKRNELPLQMPYLRVANVYYNHLDLSEIKEIGVTEQEIDRCLLEKNDLLFVEGNGSKAQIGRVAIWNGQIPKCLHQNHIVKGRPLGNMLSEYALYYLISNEGRKQIVNIAKSTSGLYTLSTNKIKGLRVPYCDLNDQKRILDDVKEKLSVYDSIEHTIDTSLQQAEALRQSILKQAFEGRLV